MSTLKFIINQSWTTDTKHDKYSEIQIQSKQSLIYFYTKTKPLHFRYEFTGHIVNTHDDSWTPANHRMRKEIFNIFKKLHKMFPRYDEQKTEPYTYTQVSNRIDLKQISMDNNLRR